MIAAAVSLLPRSRLRHDAESVIARTNLLAARDGGGRAVRPRSSGSWLGWAWTQRKNLDPAGAGFGGGEGHVNRDAIVDPPAPVVVGEMVDLGAKPPAKGGRG